MVVQLMVVGLPPLCPGAAGIGYLTTLNIGYLNAKWKFNEICSSFLSGNLDAKSDFCSVLKENAANVIKVVRTTHN